MLFRQNVKISYIQLARMFLQNVKCLRYGTLRDVTCGWKTGIRIGVKVTVKVKIMLKIARVDSLSGSSILC